jgi:SAM-dependent methyltransferase
MTAQDGFIRYLAAKRTVDDRALNRVVWERLCRSVRAQPADRTLRVLEVGAGIGTMFERIVNWGLHPRIEYTGVDIQTDLVVHAQDRLPRWAAKGGFSVTQGSAGRVTLNGASMQHRAAFIHADLYDFAASSQGETWDLLLAHAFLDIVDFPRALPAMLDLLTPRGLYYFTLNFDGSTILQPTLDPRLDAQIEALYHETMDSRCEGSAPSGSSTAGRELFHHLVQSNTRVRAVGASDWVVIPQDGAYPNDEAYFLGFIMDTIEHALCSHPELDSAEFQAWLRVRRTQLSSAELIYIAHQLDYFGEVGVAED